jgi:peroxiredoxin Q/BCP
MRHTHEFLVREREVPGVYHVFLKPDDDEQITVWKGKMEALVLKTDSLNSYISPIIYRDPNAGLARSFAVKPGYAFHNQVVNYPAMVILDPDGKEVFRYTGKSNADRLPFDKFAEKMTELRKTSK